MPCSLHSLYLALWTNFAGFCMALISQADGQQKISRVLSSWQPIRHYCVTQLRSLWLHMGNNMRLTLEEQSFFVMKCMETLLSIGTQNPQSIARGRFPCAEEEKKRLIVYERMWHDQIFTPNDSCIHSELALHQLKHLKQLELLYPSFPNMEEFSQSLMSLESIGDQKNPWYMIAQFALEYPRLKAGGELLPDLIHLYWWIHTELAYRVTREYAEKHSIAEVLSKVDKKYPEMEIFQLYERVRVAYNKYVEVVGHSIGAGACANVRRQGRIYHIEDDTCLLHFLSEEEEGTENDWLYVVIADIMEHHNSFLQRVFAAVNAKEHRNLRRYFTDHLTKLTGSGAEDTTDTLSPDSIYPTEVNDQTCIIGTHKGTSTVEEVLPLVRSRYQYPLMQPSQSLPVHPYDYMALQRDVIRAFLVGKSYFHNPGDHLRRPFKFYKPKTDSLVLGVSLADVEILGQFLKDDSGLKRKLDSPAIKKLECEFHAANYHALLAVAKGLRTATEHLVKAVCLPDAPGSRSPVAPTERTLTDLTVPQFLVEVYSQRMSPEVVMKEIGISCNLISKHQLDHLMALQLPDLYSTLKLFVQWIEDGMYDFCELPPDMKKHMNREDEDKILNLSSSLEGASIMEEIETFNNVLAHSESELRKNKEKPITVFLKDNGFYDEQENLLHLIPETILCHHYVALRVAIRRWMTAQRKNQVTGVTPADRSQQQKWAKYAFELWDEDRLGHIWKVAIPFDNAHDFVYDPALGGFAGFLGEEGTEEQLEEEDEKDELYLVHSYVPDEDQPPTPSSPDIPTPTAAPDESKDDAGLLLSTMMSPDASGPVSKAPWSQLEPQQLPEPSIHQPEVPLETIAESLTVEEVVSFLEENKFGQYRKQFEEEEVDGRLLFDLSSDDLKDLGVTNAVHRRKITRAFNDHLKKLQLKK